MAVVYPSLGGESLVIKLADGTDYENRFACLEHDSLKRREWIAGQNKLTDEVLDSIPKNGRIKGRLEELVDFETIQSSFRGVTNIHAIGNTIFYGKRKTGEEQYSLYAFDLQTRKERLLVDLNKTEFEGKLSLGLICLSSDGKYVVYEISNNGSEFAELQILDISTGDVIDRIPNTYYANPVWMPDNSGFFYSKSIKEKGLRPSFHKIGTKHEEDKLLCDKDSLSGTYIWITNVSDDGKKAIIFQTSNFSNNELLCLNLSQQDSKPVSITGNKKAQFQSSFIGDSLYILTDYEAPKFRLGRVRLNEDCPKLKDLETVVEEGNGILTDFRLGENLIYVTRRMDVSSRLFILNKEGEKEIDLGEFRSTEFIGSKEKNPLLVSQSFLDPLTIYQADGLKLEPVLRTGEALDPKIYCVEQLWTRSKDGTEIPMLVVRKRGLKLNGKNPTILEGYGGFKTGLYPGFSNSRKFWLEHDGIHVIANLRGGGEFGEQWHAAGMLDKKQNVFDDAIACAEALQGLRESRLTGEEDYTLRMYTSNKHLGITGGSNGGLLTCAVLVQRPNLFSAIVSKAPFTNMARFASTEAGKGWIGEYGDPENPKHLKHLRDYSPIDYVFQVEYPAVYLRAGALDDSGVDPFHAMEMAAKLQTSNRSNNPILLRISSDTGHGHGKSLQQTIEGLTEEYAFFTHYLGLKVF